MAITGIDTIDGKQIIAAGAVSAKSAEMAYNDENGNPITSYLTAVPEGYATIGDLNDLVTSISETYQPTAGMTAYQSAGDYLTTGDSANFYTTANESGFITGVDLTPYQLIADMTAYQPVGDYLTTGDSANFYTTANESGFISEVPAGTMNESAFEYDANDKISGYNGSAFAGGSDVPEGVMVETGLEYNAVNEISGYNGSAIAQYGAEKQWLVHDDTLVHAANSAQYALGVNLSAVAQLLGVDETVLFEGSSANPTLSESINNFKKVDIVYTYWSDKYTTITLYGWSANPTFTEGWYNEGGTFGGIFITRLTANDSHTVIGSDSNRYWNPPTGSTLNDATSNFKILKVIGIGRKS